MPRYYFNIRSDGALIVDSEGSDLPDEAAAIDEALQSAQQLLAEKVACGDLVDGQQFEIIDESGLTVAIVPFQRALRLHMR